MRQLTTIILICFTLTSFGQDKDSTETTNYVFISDPMPSYPGGVIEMDKFIKDNLIYPKNPRKLKEKVFVSFNVNEDGSLSDFFIVKGVGEPFDSIAIETLKKMPHWIPATNGTRPFRTKYVLPVKFDR